jgi:heme/copper-type cytochrome/quinol oxidase subunit 1
MKPAYLFLFLGLIAVGLSFIFDKQIIEVIIHDTYVLIDYRYFFIPIFILSLLTALCYWLMEKFRKPISSKAGYWHFTLIVSGLFFCFYLFKFGQMIFNSNNPPDAVSLSGVIIELLLGPLLLLSGFITFIVAFINALRKKTSG